MHSSWGARRGHFKRNFRENCFHMHKCARNLAAKNFWWKIKLCIKIAPQSPTFIPLQKSLNWNVMQCKGIPRTEKKFFSILISIWKVIRFQWNSSIFDNFFIESKYAKYSIVSFFAQNLIWTWVSKIVQLEWKPLYLDR